jgi:serine/threonine protein kinase
MANSAELLRLLRQPPGEQSDADVEAEGRCLESLALTLASGADPVPGDADALRDVFRALLNDRALADAYRLPPDAPGAAPPGRALRVLQCARLLLRERRFVDELFAVDGAARALADKYRTYAALHFAATSHIPSPTASPSRSPSPAAPASDPASSADRAFHFEILSELASVFKKLATDAADARDAALLASADVHRVAVSLLATSDASLLASALVTLCAQTEASETCAAEVAETGCVHRLLRIARDYQPPFRGLAAELAARLCRTREGRRETRRAGGAEALCALVRARAEERDWAACEALLRALGGVLADRTAAAEANADVVADALAGLLRDAGRAAIRADSDSSAGRSSTPSAGTPAAATCLACSALTKLAVDDEGGDCIRRRNGVYLLGRLLVDTREAEDEAAARAVTRIGAGSERSEASAVGDASPSSTAREVQAHAFRALRFAFSVERNRRMFKRLFPPSLFAAFIDVGHYKQDMTPYRALARAWRSLGDEEARAAAAAFEEIDATRGGAARARAVGEYALTDILGQGAFGRVYRAHKARHPETTACAVKELDPSRDAATFGATPEEVSLSVGRMASEVQILKRLEHPNIVNYLDSFREGGMLYIVMELVDGASLLDHITSTAEKGRRMREERVWDIFLQTVLALHYIHSEKGVVHRDLTPNNILLEHDSGRVKIADFGLAKAQPRTSESGREMSTRERRHAEVMQSAVGTMPYSCPEIIMHEGYGAKADVWSLGCVLYHMLALVPPFRGSNPLAMAQDIVEGRYPSLEPLVRRKSIASHAPNGAVGGGGDVPGGDVPGSGGAGLYSAALVGLVDRLLTVDSKRRPSISEVAAACAPRLTRSLDRLRADNDRLRREADRRRERDATEAVTERRRRDAMRRLALAEGGGEGGDVTTTTTTMTTTAAAASVLAEVPVARVSDGNGVSASESSSAPNSFKIPPARLRAVADPVSQIISALHKLVFLDQLPPARRRDPRRAAAERYKRFLFSSATSAGTIKAQAAKLLAGAREPVPVPGLVLGDDETDESPGEEVTYEDLARVVEELLLENGFYDANRGDSR